MKISESWLREWVNPQLTTQALASQLTMAGLEVDAIYPVAGAFDHVVVARVVTTRSHPKADRLTLCEVDPGDGKLIPVVCGASNVRPGLTVALAMIGAHLPGDLIIKETLLRGEPSMGMLCAAEELGLTESGEGILELADDAPLGLNLREYLALDDDILDLDLTPNRADCLSVLGVAREVAAINSLTLQQKEIPLSIVTADDRLSIHLDAPSACSSYLGRCISNINPHATTPLLIKERLRRSDIRPIHPIVDVLNYVMLELGHPMHAFDRASVQGDIHVRYARPGEQLTLLGGREVSLDENVLVIADAQKALAMAGVMGGDASSVQAHTTDIWIEAAYFDPLAIVGVARRFGLSSDAAHRFERGVDPYLSQDALEAATSLLHSIVGGDIGPIVHMTDSKTIPQTVIIPFHPSQVLRLSGMTILDDDMEAIFTRLGMKVVRQAAVWGVTIPSYRFDLRLEVDLVEEIVRMVGYDKIPNLPLASTMRAGTVDADEQLSADMIQFLSHRGYRETISYSFVDPQLQEALYPDVEVKTLMNPLSSELSVMRVGLWPGLLASMLHNIHRQHSALKLCEIGKVFLHTDGRLEERFACAGLMVGEFGQFSWSDQAGQYDLFDMKGELQALFATLKLDDIDFIAGVHPALHPGKTAQVVRAGRPIGWLGVLHPRLSEVFDVSADVMMFEVNVSLLHTSQRLVYQSISKFPQIRRDLSLLVDEEVTAASLEAVVRDVVDPALLKGFYIFDVYTGGDLASEHKKSLALGVVLQSDHHTLNDTDINVIMNSIVAKLEHTLQAVLRTVTE